MSMFDTTGRSAEAAVALRTGRGAIQEITSPERFAGASELKAKLEKGGKMRVVKELLVSTFDGILTGCP